MSQKTVLIVGGGIAGISAAVWSLHYGWKPLLVESSPNLGGRARSLFAKDVQNYVDNGQHVLAANYHDTRHLLKQIGSLDKIYFQPHLAIDFKINYRRNFYFKTFPVPAPFHFLLPLFINSPFRKEDFRFIFRWAKIFRNISLSQLKKKTVREWLDMAGQAPLLEKVFWEPLTLATLNTPLEQASAFLLYQVLQKGFINNSKHSGLGLSKAMLSDIFANPATKYIREKGGQILPNARIKKVVMDGEKITSIETNSGKRIDAPVLILATPPNNLSKIITNSPGLQSAFVQDFSKFQYSPIITITLWFNKPLNGRFPKSLVDSPIQWIFKMPVHTSKKGLYGYTVVISAAIKQVGLSDSELLEMIEREFLHFFSKSIFEHLGLVSHKIIREKTATILQTPQSLTLRPLQTTPIANLFLAGDWTATDLPATIEGAAMSGRLAVEAFTEIFGFNKTN